VGSENFFAANYEKRLWFFSQVKNAKDLCLPESFNKQGEYHELPYSVLDMQVDASEVRPEDIQDRSNGFSRILTDGKRILY